MSDSVTKRMIARYNEEATAPMFLSSFFRTPPENFHTTETVEVDIEREHEDIAVVLTDLSQGPRQNEATKLTNKEFKPPIFDEEFTLSSFELLKRQAGDHPFQDPNYTANAIRRAFSGFRKIENKIRRSVEEMSSQVLQTGSLTLKDSDGNALYSLDFQPQSSHFPTVTDSWGTASETPVDDIESLCRVIRQDGRVMPNQAIFGNTAWRNFQQSDQFQNLLDNRRIEVGGVAPESPAPDAVFQGYLWFGSYRVQMWTYEGFYRDPATGTVKTYVDANKVIVKSTDSRLDLTFGAIPQIVAPDPRLTGFIGAMPGRIPNVNQGMDLTTNAWITPDNRHLMVSAGTRPLTIPTAIDSFGALDTQV